MGMQKYRADISNTQADGAIIWCAKWLGGLSLAKIENCRLDKIAGDMRANVFVTGEADTAFSIPAVCSLFGKRVRGYLTDDDDGNLVFRQCYY
jgi:hypothetical protein